MNKDKLVKENGIIKNVYLTIPKDRPWLLCLFIDIESEKGGSFHHLFSCVNLNRSSDNEKDKLVNNIVKLLRAYKVNKLEDIKNRKIICLVDGMIIKGVELVGENND